jgi:putative membrane-bound dehydrogenase-like protein
LNAKLTFLLLAAALLLLAAAFPAAADEFPAPFNHGDGADQLPLSPDKAAAGFQLPEGFRASVFAAEPNVQNPVAMTWDSRGRLWVAECYTYADRPTKHDLTLRDRVVILADRDGDGRAEERKVFCDNVQRLMSVEVGLGGVWLICLPQLLFIPDRNGDDVPDGAPEVVLDGFGISPENYHNCANGLRWGPDGWLYGRCGASSPGRIGAPGASDAERVPIFGGLWRYHPTRRVFETICHGTTNPWGHDWDAHGELFFTNTVTGHLFHVIPGAHYTRSATIAVNRRVYEPIDTHADHLHYQTRDEDTGRGWSDRSDANDSLGGGHAHCGAMIYLADQWPAEYRGRLMTLNFHGRRINVERLEREGTGFVARHEPDIALAEDKWFRGIDLSYGPDGAVYVLDWSDTGECHEHDGIHRLSGRVFRIAYGDEQQRSAVNLTKLSLTELVKLHNHANEWFVRQARRELANRAASGVDVAVAIRDLRERLDRTDADVQSRLRALWSLHSLGATDAAALTPLLDDPSEHVRVWALRLLTDFWPLDTVHGLVRSTPQAIDSQLAERLTAMAQSDPSGLVRLSLASTLQRLPAEMRPKLALALAAHAEIADDHNLPSLLWYGLAPLAETDPAALVPIASQGKLPLTREWIARALAEDIAKDGKPLDQLLAAATSQEESVRADVVRGIAAGLAGRHRATPPSAWQNFQATFAVAPEELQAQVRGISVVFGDGRALDEVRRIALDNDAPIDQRRLALEALIDARPDDLRKTCEKLLRVRFLNVTAMKGLTMFDDPEIGEQLAKNYSRFHPSERASVLETLVARPAFAAGLLDQIAAGGIPREELTATHARQLRSFGDESLTARLSEVWGELRDSPQDKQDHIARLKAELTPERLSLADKRQGRAVFQATCANCHRLFGAGGTIGPDLTGSGRHNLDYVVSNIVDPSGVVAKEFRMSLIRHVDGRILSGLLISQDDERLVLQTVKERLTIPREDVADQSLSTLSTMPDGLLQPLKEEHVRDLIAYLMSPGQVELPASLENSVNGDDAPK